jgi:hypothetical protein
LGNASVADVYMAQDSSATVHCESVIMGAAPPGAAAMTAGTAGEIRVDGDYIYVCTATDTWKRVAVSTW